MPVVRGRTIAALCLAAFSFGCGGAQDEERPAAAQRAPAPSKSQAATPCVPDVGSLPPSDALLTDAETAHRLGQLTARSNKVILGLDRSLQADAGRPITLEVAMRAERALGSAVPQLVSAGEEMVRLARRLKWNSLRACWTQRALAYRERALAFRDVQLSLVTRDPSAVRQANARLRRATTAALR